MSKDKVRLYQLAKEWDVETKYLIDLLQAAGQDVKNHMTAIDADTRALAEDLVKGKLTPAQIKAQRGGSPAAVVEPPPAAAPAKPAPIPDPKMPKPSVISTPAKLREQPEPSLSPPVEEEPAPPPTSEPVEMPISAAAEEPKDARPIPAPSRNRIVSLDTNPGGAGKGIPSTRERRPAAQRPIIAVPPPMSEPTARESKPAADSRAQKPVMKLSPEQLRVGKFPKADEAEAGATGDFDEEGPRGRSPRGGGSGTGNANVGREERQRRRGQRAAERKIIEKALGGDDEEVRRRRSRVRPRMKDLRASQSGPIAISLPATVRSFSEACGIKVADVIKKLMEATGGLLTINSSLTEEEIGMLALALEIEVDIKRVRDAEEELEEASFSLVDPEETLVPRPPVVTFMGHVDHGKTSLMDRIRRANVVASEAGGITQHIGAYQVQTPTGKVTFLDTPGHEAFTAMRARGANITDIVVLVVAADDGVMPQTEEAINHAKAASVPIIVAMNKSDLPGANFDKVLQQLSQHNLIPEEWGGDTQIVRTSATTGMGVDNLLERIQLLADLHELKANPGRAAIGSCIEATKEGDRGVEATILVLKGTLRTGDVILCGPAFGRVRVMYDDHGKLIDEAGPSTPVVIYGLDDVPEAGERFVVIDDLARAGEIAAERQGRLRIESQQVRQHVSLDKLYEQKQSREVQDLKLILKADVRGSLEAIKVELGKLDHDEVKIKILHDAVGAVNESDVLLADTSDAIIIAFQVIPDPRAETLARDKGVEIRRYDIIYQVSDDIRKAMEGMLIPDKKEVQLGRAIVQETFSISRFGTIAGCRVVSGTIERNAQLRVIRDGTVVGVYPIDSLKRHKDDAKEVREGLECGIKVAGFNDVKKGDLFEAFKIEEVKRTL